MNWRIVRFTIRQRTYGDHLEQGSLTIYHALFRLIIKKGKSVLVLAHSNAAVDVLMSEVTKQIEKKKEMDTWRNCSLRL